MSIVVGMVGLVVLGLAYTRRMSSHEEPGPRQENEAKKRPASNEVIAGALRVALAESAEKTGDNGAKRPDYIMDMETGEFRRVAEDVRDAFLGPILDGSKPQFLQFCKLLEKVHKHLPADDPKMVDAIEVDLRELSANPEKYRGFPVTVRGTIA